MLTFGIEAVNMVDSNANAPVHQMLGPHDDGAEDACKDRCMHASHKTAGSMDRICSGIVLELHGLKVAPRTVYQADALHYPDSSIRTQHFL